jgi:hypothetical protein
VRNCETKWHIEASTVELRFTNMVNVKLEATAARFNTVPVLTSICYGNSDAA